MYFGKSDETARKIISLLATPAKKKKKEGVVNAFPENIGQSPFHPWEEKDSLYVDYWARVKASMDTVLECSQAHHFTH